MTRGPDKQFDRDQALEQALNVFWKRGYNATSIGDLVEQMHIGRQSLYDTFGSKRELFVEAVSRYAQRQVGEISEMLRAPGSPMGNVRKVFDRWQRMATERHDCGCLVGNTIAEIGPHDVEIGTYLQAGLERVRQAFAETLERAQAAGEIPGHLVPGDLAKLIVTASQGAALITKVQPDNDMAFGAMRALLETLEVAPATH